MKVPLNTLGPAFYDRSPEVVARQLLGKAIIRKVEDSFLGGLIVETEAYLSVSDPASHSCRGITRRNQSMFGKPGTLYVYTIHAKYCLNAVTQSMGVGSAVLVRAVEPVWSIARMRRNRGRDDVRQLCRGPAMLCQAIEVGLAEDGLDLCTGEQLWIADIDVQAEVNVKSSGRIGISQAADLPLRFFVDGNRYVSGRALLHGKPNRNSLLANLGET